MKEKVKKKNVEIAFINVVLYPTEKQEPGEYVKLLSSIMGCRVMIPSQNSDRSTLLRQFDNCGDFYHGYFCNAIFLKEDSKTLNVEKNVLEDTEIDPNKGLEAKDMEFWFYPKYHRFAVYKSNVTKISKFLFGSFMFKLGDEDSFAIFIEKDKNSIDRIIRSEGIVSVCVKVKYANNDNCDDWEDLEANMRESNTLETEFKAKGAKNNPIIVAANRILKAFLNLSKSYGTAKAEIINENGHTEKIDTKDHPKTTVVNLEQDPAKDLGDMIEGIATNRE